jgi:hypothetical protein
MKRFTFWTFFVVTAIAGSLEIATGQTINARVQTTGSRGAPATATKPVSTARVAPHLVRPPGSTGPQRLNANLPRSVSQPAAYLPRTFPPIVRNSNYSVATLDSQRGGPMQQTSTVDPAIRQTELRTLATMHQRRGIVTREGDILDPMMRPNENQRLAASSEHPGSEPAREMNESDSAPRGTELRTLETLRDQHASGADNQTSEMINPQSHFTENAPEPVHQREKVESPKDSHGKKAHNKKDRISFDEAFRRHWHEWHDRNWWHSHCDTIVFVPVGYYFLDGSYWYPAYGYDPFQTYYDYDGPIYTYSNLLPDEVIANVQTALQDAGYYYGPITGSLSVDTRAAIANFQRDNGLAITGAIDEDTVAALGLY